MAGAHAASFGEDEEDVNLRARGTKSASARLHHPSLQAYGSGHGLGSGGVDGGGAAGAHAASFAEKDVGLRERDTKSASARLHHPSLQASGRGHGLDGWDIGGSGTAGAYAASFGEEEEDVRLRERGTKSASARLHHKNLQRGGRFRSEGVLGGNAAGAHAASFSKEDVNLRERGTKSASARLHYSNPHAYNYYGGPSVAVAERCSAKIPLVGGPPSGTASGAFTPDYPSGIASATDYPYGIASVEYPYGIASGAYASLSASGVKALPGAPATEYPSGIAFGAPAPDYPSGVASSSTSQLDQLDALLHAHQERLHARVEQVR